MEPEGSANTPGTPIPEKLALTAVVCALAGSGLLLATVGLIFLMGNAADARPGTLQSLAGWVFFLSLPLVYLVTPLLGGLLGLAVRDNWQAIVAPQAQSRDEVALVRLARRLLTTAVLLGLVSGPPAIGAILDGRSLHVALPGGLSVLLLIAALAASYVSYVAAKLYAQLPGRALPRIVALFVVPVAVIVLASYLPIGGYGYHLRDRAAYAKKTPAHEGTSTSLARTAVVPTLDSPCPPNRNVVWCSSFQLTWNEIRDNVIGEPLRVVGAEAVAGRLNTAEQSMADLEPGSVYAAGGWIEQGIINTIEHDMAARFPSHVVPDFNDYKGTGGILAYSYLTAQVPFKHPFRQVEEAFTFSDSQGNQTDVEAFGLWEAHLGQYQNMREQVDILFCRSEDPRRSWEVDEYAIDLCKHSAPYQVVVAVVEPNESLSQMYDCVQAQAEEFKQREYYEEARQLQKPDVLRVPEIFWEIDHRFQELIGKIVANVGVPIVEALQTIRFRLDRSGAMLESEARMIIAAMPRHFEFNRPFLVYMQKRGAAQPFFVMWVDNAELLVVR